MDVPRGGLVAEPDLTYIFGMIRRDAMNFTTLAFVTLTMATAYSAWLTSIVFCSTHHLRPLLIAAAAFFPVGIVHGIGVWFGGW